MLTCPVKLWASARRTGRLQANTSAGTFDHRLVQRRNPQLFLPVSQQASTTLNLYAQSIPETAKATVKALDRKLCGVLNTTEHKYEM